MKPAAETDRPPRRRWLRVVLLLLLLFVVLPLAAFVGWHRYLNHRYGRQLAEAIARTDALDPGWTLDELEAARATVPDDENGANVVLTAHRLLPPRWPPTEWDLRFLDHPSPHLLSEGQAAALGDDLRPAEDAVREARRLAERPRGRFAVRYGKDCLTMEHVHVQETRDVVQLLAVDLARRNRSGDTAGALVDAIAILHANRTLVGEPSPLAAVARLGIRSIALNGLCATLAQGQPGAEALASMQRRLEEELRDNALVHALRGERACQHATWTAVAAERVALESLSGTPRPPRLGEQVAHLWVAPRVLQGHAEILDTLNDAITAARQPPEDHLSSLKEMEDRVRSLSPIARSFLISWTRIAEANARFTAGYRCAVVALAAERYRIRHGTWPLTASALVPDFLDAVPTDPFAGRPVTLRRMPDGLVVFSVGENRKDDGGVLAKLGDRPDGPHDRGFRLWDVAKRRQPPEPVPLKPDDAEPPRGTP